MIIVKNNTEAFNLLKKQEILLTNESILSERKFNDHLINGKIELDFIKENIDKINWGFISMNPNITCEIINEYFDKIVWKNIYLFGRCDENFIKMYIDYFPIKELMFSSRFLLSNEFIQSMLLSSCIDVYIEEYKAFKKVGIFKDKSLSEYVLLFDSVDKTMITQKSFMKLNCRNKTVMNTEIITDALDKTVEEIKSMSKEELNEHLAESSNSEFAKTIDQFNLREDCFDIKDNIEKLIQDRAYYIAAALLEVVNSYEDINLIPDIYSMHRLNCNIRKWTETTYPPNPDFVDSKNSLSWIVVDTDYIELNIVKETDTWDDYDDSASWTYNKIPYKLGIAGTREELMEFFRNMFKEKIDFERKLNNETLYSQIFNMDYDVVRKIIDFQKPASYKEYNKILIDIGLNVRARDD